MTRRELMQALAVAPASLAQQPAAQPVEPTPEQRHQLDSRLRELAGIVSRLQGRPRELVADVEIFLKAGQWTREFPEEFFTAADVTNAIAVLDGGLQRGRQLLDGAAPWLKQTGRRIHGFYSELDGSVQLYGLRVPESYDSGKPSRLYVWLHGRDQRNTEVNFITRFQKVSAAHTNPEELGQLQLDVYGRWNGMAYHWTGEADLFEALADVQRRYKIDEDRVLLRGFSMGGCGAWHISLHHPDRFAAAEIGAGTWPRRAQLAGHPDYQARPLRIYENILDWSLNAYNLPLAGHGGDSETGRGSIPAPPPGTPTRGQLESSMKVREQLEREGFPSKGDPHELYAEGTDAQFHISKNTGHSTSPEVRQKLNAFLKKYGDRGRVSPDRLRFLTYTTRYNRHHWATLEQLEKHYERAEIDAKRSGAKLEIATRNLVRLTLRETEAVNEIRIDGQTLNVRPARQVSLEKRAAGWVVANAAPKGLRKIHGLQGPIDDAFLEPFLLVRPTHRQWHAAAHEKALRLLSRFDKLYAKNLRAHPRVKDDRDVTAADTRRYNLILFGDPGSNLWISRVLGGLPLKWTRESVSVAGESFPAADHFPVLVYPNPLHPSKYVVLNSGFTFEASEYATEYQMPRLGDYAVMKVREGEDWPDTALAGIFDERWRIAT
jgi:pimeloyl-ACP methyl ester carboxylesterase